MQPYRKALKQLSRKLRADMTEAEQLLWQRLRGKQIDSVQFYRQKPLLSFIVDFYAPAAKLVIELDGGQHFDIEHQMKDQQRDAALAANHLHVLRFDNLQVLRESEAVLAVIHEWVVKRKANPP